MKKKNMDIHSVALELDEEGRANQCAIVMWIRKRKIWEEII